jgi:pyruvate formate lyase activating enzyme
MRCQYCYNAEIVLGKGKISEEDALNFLDSRRGLLDAVVLSGGECTLYGELISFVEKIKAKGFLVKLDTNGLKPQVVQTLLINKLVDYVALDYKAPLRKFHEITRTYRFSQFESTLKFLAYNDFPFEVRTTVHTDLLTKDDLDEIINHLVQVGYRGIYYIQKYVHKDSTLGSLQNPSCQFQTMRFDHYAQLNIDYRNFNLSDSSHKLMDFI